MMKPTGLDRRAESAWQVTLFACHPVAPPPSRIVVRGLGRSHGPVDGQ